MVWGWNSGGGEIFRIRPDWPWGAPSGFREIPGGKEEAACRGSRKRVELYLYSPWEVFKACNRVGPSLYFTTDTFSCLQLALFLTFFNNISSKQSRVSWRQTRYLSRYSYYATGWTTKELRFDSLIGKGSIFYSKLSWPQLASSQSSINDCPRVIFPEGNRMGHESDHSPPSSNKFKNEWSYTSAPPICLHCLHSYNCTLVPIFSKTYRPLL